MTGSDVLALMYCTCLHLPGDTKNVKKAKFMKKRLPGKVTSIKSVTGLVQEKKSGVLTLPYDFNSEDDFQHREPKINHLTSKMVNTLLLQRGKRAREVLPSRMVAKLNWVLHRGEMDSRKPAHLRFSFSKTLVLC